MPALARLLVVCVCACVCVLLLLFVDEGGRALCLELLSAILWAIGVALAGSAGVVRGAALWRAVRAYFEAVWRTADRPVPRAGTRPGHAAAAGESRVPTLSIMWVSPCIYYRHAPTSFLTLISPLRIQTV